MKKNILTTALCSSILLLTACDSGTDNNDSYNGSSSVDYSKAKTIDLISMPVTGLISSELDNFIIEIAHIAEEIHYSSNDTNTTVACKSGGTLTPNSNGSITLNNCKDIAFNGKVYEPAEDATISGTINSKISNTDNTEQYDITLTNLTVKYDNGDIETYSGNIVEKFVNSSANVKASYAINNMIFSWANKTNKQNYILSNYTLNETISSSSSSSLTPAVAKGKLQGDINGEKFSVNFDSNVKYSWSNSSILTDASIKIEDTSNRKNAITITNSTDGKAFISAYANGVTVTGYPKTENWDYFY